MSRPPAMDLPPSTSPPPKRPSPTHTWPEPELLVLRREWISLHDKYRAERSAINKEYKAERAAIDPTLRQLSDQHRRRAQADARREGPDRLWRALLSYARERWRFRRSEGYREAVRVHGERRRELKERVRTRQARALDEYLERKESVLRRMPRGLETFKGIPK